MQVKAKEKSYSKIIKSRSSIVYGFRQLNPLLGVNYKFKFDVNDSRRSYSKTNIPRRIISVRQPFLEPELRTVTVAAEQPKRVNFILTLAGRSHTFRRFLDNFEASCLRSEPYGSVTLTVVLFHDAGDVGNIENRIELTRSQFPGVHIHIEPIVGCAFSRGVGLQRGARLFAREALLVFTDVDIRIRSDIIRRIRMNVVRRTQAYFPTIFSYYDPRFTSNDSASLKSRERDATVSSLNSITFEDDIGYWRRYSYGIVALYNEDFIRVGGFNLSIQGWGLEDTLLYERFVACNITVFHAIDFGFVHDFHDKICDRTELDEDRYLTCLGSQRRSLGSTRVLAAYVRETPEIYWRDATSRIRIYETGTARVREKTGKPSPIDAKTSAMKRIVITP